MRYSKDHKEETRRRIVDVASKSFRRDGIVATGVVALMSEAGMTQGGFYSHFASKDALVEEAIGSALKETRRFLQKLGREGQAAGRSALGAMIDGYVRIEHVNAPELGCSIAFVGPEMSRMSDGVRRIAFVQASEIAELIENELPANISDRAIPLFAMMAGTIQLARLAGTRTEQLAILANGRRSARVFAGISEEA